MVSTSKKIKLISAAVIGGLASFGSVIFYNDLKETNFQSPEKISLATYQKYLTPFFSSNIPKTQNDTSQNFDPVNQMQIEMSALCNNLEDILEEYGPLKVRQFETLKRFLNATTENDLHDCAPSPSFISESCRLAKIRSELIKKIETLTRNITTMQKYLESTQNDSFKSRCIKFTIDRAQNIFKTFEKIENDADKSNLDQVCKKLSTEVESSLKSLSLIERSLELHNKPKYDSKNNPVSYKLLQNQYLKALIKLNRQQLDFKNSLDEFKTLEKVKCEKEVELFQKKFEEDNRLNLENLRSKLEQEFDSKVKLAVDAEIKSSFDAKIKDISNQLENDYKSKISSLEDDFSFKISQNLLSTKSEIEFLTEQVKFLENIIKKRIAVNKNWKNFIGLQNFTNDNKNSAEAYEFAIEVCQNDPSLNFIAKKFSDAKQIKSCESGIEKKFKKIFYENRHNFILEESQISHNLLTKIISKVFSYLWLVDVRDIEEDSRNTSQKYSKINTKFYLASQILNHFQNSDKITALTKLDELLKSTNTSLKDLEKLRNDLRCLIESDLAMRFLQCHLATS